MLVDVFCPLLAGIGLFFVGVTFVSTNLKQMTSRKIRLFLARFTGRDWQSAIIGALTGFVTQSTSVAAFIVAGLISSGLMKVRNALPVVFWANAGCSILVIVAVMNIKYFVYLLLFVSGVCTAFDKPYKYRYFSRALFGIGLLFFGLEMIQSGATPLAGMPWVKSSLAYTHGSLPLAFIIGTILTIITQTALGMILIAITMTAAGLFTVNQTIMLIYGAHMGSAVVTWLLSSGIKGSPKQLIMSQVLFNICGVILMTVLFYVEIYGGLPLFKALVEALSTDMEQQMAYLVVIFNCVVPLSIFGFHGIICRFLENKWPPTEEEALSKIKFIHEHALDVPETALDMVERETGRLLERFPLYLTSIRAALEGRADNCHETYHSAFMAVNTEIAAVLSDIANSEIHEETGKRLLHIKNRQDLIIGLEECVYGMCVAGSHPPDSAQMRSFYESAVESQEFLLMTAADTSASPTTTDIEFLGWLTQDNCDAIQRIRSKYLSLDASATIDEKAALHHASNLYERVVWTLNKYAVHLLSV